MQRATAVPSKRAAYHDKVLKLYSLYIFMCKFQTEPVQNRLYKSLKVWSMYADLEESLGTFDVSTFQTGSSVECIIPFSHFRQPRLSITE